MVQVIENQASIQGQIQAIKASQSLAGYDVVTLLLTATQPVPGKVNLLSQPIGTTLDVTVLHSLLADAKVGDVLFCRAKKTPNGVMCEKEPAPGSFSITPPP